METMEAVKKESKTGSRSIQLEELYESAFPIVAKFVKSMGGSYDDAKDIFHDALVVYFEMNADHVYSSPKAYVMGIAKHMYIRKHNRSKATVSFSGMEMQIQIPEDYFPTVDTKRLLHYLESAGKRCMDLLRAFYYQKKQLNMLVQSMGFSNEHSASVQKYKCLEKVREMVKQKSLAYEDFIE